MSGQEGELPASSVAAIQFEELDLYDWRQDAVSAVTVIPTWRQKVDAVVRGRWSVCHDSQCEVYC